MKSQKRFWNKVLYIMLWIAVGCDISLGKNVRSLYPRPRLMSHGRGKFFKPIYSFHERNKHHKHKVEEMEGIMMADEPEDLDKEDEGSSWSDYLNTLFDPVFDPEVSSNISAVIGQTAHLPCRVNNLGTKTVSWIRHRDTHILTVGSFPYTGDKRFSALHREGTNEWTLQILNPRVNDSGLYECQVSTKPVRAYLVRLDVLEPTARILHAPVLHTDEGGILNLTCIVSPSPTPPEYIFWYHKDEVINYETDKRVQVILQQERDRTVTSLVVNPASMNHSGVYTCEPSNAASSQIVVHLFKAEEPAAMQTSSGRPTVGVSIFFFSPLFLQFFTPFLTSPDGFPQHPHFRISISLIYPLIILLFHSPAILFFSIFTVSVLLVSNLPSAFFGRGLTPTHSLLAAYD